MTGADSELPVAGLSRRIAAMLYDWLLLAGLLLVFTLLAVMLRGGAAIPPGTIWFELSLLLVVVAFFCFFWTRGQTLGMRAWKLRIERRDGGPVSLRAALARLGAAVLSLLPLGLGFVWCVVDREGSSWHDRLSGTRIVRVSEPARARRP
jgi:uncharacterized RDD family membrane protein YckC